MHSITICWVELNIREFKRALVYLGWKAVINSTALNRHRKGNAVGKMKLSQRALIYGIASALFAAGFAVRFLSLPAWLDLMIYGIFAAPVIWMVCRELIKRKAEKRMDREAAWRNFIRDRNVR
jgi:hypothetical protein